MNLRRTPIGITVALAAVLAVAVACGAPEAQVTAVAAPRPEGRPSPSLVPAQASPVVTVTQATPSPSAVPTRALSADFEVLTALPLTPAVVAETTPGL